MNATMTANVITVSDYRALKVALLSVDVKFTRRDCGGWYVTRRDNGRHLGWVVLNTWTDPKRATWESYPSSSAFRGESLADEGDLLDHVDSFVVGGIVHARRVAVDETRQEAAHSLLAYLVRNVATAVTGQRSPYCTPRATS